MKVDFEPVWEAMADRAKVIEGRPHRKRLSCRAIRAMRLKQMIHWRTAKELSYLWRYDSDSLYGYLSKLHTNGVVERRIGPHGRREYRATPLK